MEGKITGEIKDGRAGKGHTCIDGERGGEGSFHLVKGQHGGMQETKPALSVAGSFESYPSKLTLNSPPVELEIEKIENRD